MRISDWSSDVCSSDLDRIPFGQGTYGSRSLTVTGSALYLATGRVVEKSRKIASALLECDVADVEITHGRLVVVGTDRSVSFQEVSHAAYFGWGQDSAVEYGLEEQVVFDRSEEHPAELQSLMRTAYAVVCFKKSTNNT